VWAFVRPGDVRGHAVALNAAVIAYFAAASSVATIATVYLGPRLW
jgi:hypothetical protein